MQSVLTTPTFEKQAARLGLSEAVIAALVSAIARDPMAGDLMVGTGGARKLRHAGRGKGKSGGWRTIHHYGGEDVPVFLLAVYGKGEKDNLTKSERNELAAVLPLIADLYRRRTR